MYYMSNQDVGERVINERVIDIYIYIYVCVCVCVCLFRIYLSLGSNSGEPVWPSGKAFGW